MVLQKLSILNFKNIESATLDFSSNMNCLIGRNGMGKTNLLDAVYYLSFCHSLFNPIDSQIIRHSADFFMLEGTYSGDDGGQEIVCCSMKSGQKKHFKRNKKEYRRLSEHVGMIPLVMVSPSDNRLIEGGSEDRRKLMDLVISQTDRTYIETLNRYVKALQQRNAMLKAEEEPNIDVIAILEEQMAMEGEVIYSKRKEFVNRLVPMFQHFYDTISLSHETVGMEYISHCQRGALLEIIQRDRFKDRAVGYSLHGVHRDDLVFNIDGHLMRREGSQGQNKTFVIALKLAQFEFLRHTSASTTPILLLDDIFDKLDAQRVEQIVGIVSSENFGQIFITDTNRDNLDRILQRSGYDYRLFHVEEGHINVSTRS